MVKVKIINNKDELIAHFIDDRDKIVSKLGFKLEDWVDPIKNGFITTTCLKIINPEEMDLEYDYEYNIDEETGNRIYKNLYFNKWTIKE